MKDTQQLNERYLLNYFIFAQAVHLRQYCQVWRCYVGCMVISFFTTEFLLEKYMNQLNLIVAAMQVKMIRLSIWGRAKQPHFEQNGQIQLDNYQINSLREKEQGKNEGRGQRSQCFGQRQDPPVRPIPGETLGNLLEKHIIYIKLLC